MRNSSVFIAVVLFCINIVSYADDSCPGCFVGRPEIEKHLIPLSKALILEKCRELSLPQEENLDISDLFMADEFEKEDSDISLIEQCDCTLIDKSPERIKKALEKKTRDNQYKIGDKLNTLFLHKAKTIITTTQFLNKFASSNITPKDYPGCSIKNISPEKLGCSLDLINKNLTRYFPPQNGRSIDLNDFRNMSYKRFLEDSRKNNHQCLQDQNIHFSAWDSKEGLETPLLSTIFDMYSGKNLSSLFKFLKNDKKFNGVFKKGSTPVSQLKRFNEYDGIRNIGTMINKNPIVVAIFSNWDSLEYFRKKIKNKTRQGLQKRDSVQTLTSILKDKKLQKLIAKGMDQNCEKVFKFAKKLLCAREDQTPYSSNYNINMINKNFYNKEMPNRDKNSDDLIAFCQSQICAQTKKVVLPGDFESYCEAIGRGPLNIDPDIDDLLDTTPEDVFNSISGYGMFRGGKIQHSFQKLCNYKKENTGELSELANIACTGSSKDDARCNDTYFKVLKLIGRHQQTSSEKSARSGDTNERISEKTEIADNPEGDSGAGKYVLERDSDNSESYDLISHLFDLPLPEPVEPVNIPERKVVAQNQIKDGNVKEQVIHTTTSKKGMDTGRTQTSLTQTVMPKGSRRIVDTGQKFQRLPTRKTGNEIIQPPVASSSANKFVRSPGTETTHFSPVRESLAFGSGTSNKSFEKNSKYSDLNNAIDKTFAKYQKRRIPTNEIREIYTPDTSNRAFFGSNTGIANVPSISSQQMRNALRNTNISQGDLVQNGIPNTSAIISSLANKKNIATAKVYRNLIQNKLDKNGKIEKSDFSNISKKLGVDISKPFLTFNNGLPVLIKPVFDKDGNITGHQPIAKISQKMLTMLTKEQEELIKNYKQGRASHKQLEKILDQMSPWKKTNQYEIWLIRDSSGRPCALAKTPTDGVCRFYLSPAVELDQNKFISIKTLNSIGIMLRHSDSQQEIGKFFETLN